MKPQNGRIESYICRTKFTTAFFTLTVTAFTLQAESVVVPLLAIFEADRSS
jgi:hypothetical protein